ncbi:MAG: OsmC family protein [Raineya sp.]
MEKLICASLGEQNYRVDIRSAKHQIFADEPQGLGGSDTAMNPYELLAASLAACTLATLRMYAQRKQWLLGEISIQIHSEASDENGIKKIRFLRIIHFEENIDQEKKERLRNIADACPISKILKSSNNTIETIVE